MSNVFPNVFGIIALLFPICSLHYNVSAVQPKWPDGLPKRRTRSRGRGHGLASRQTGRNTMVQQSIATLPDFFEPLLAEQYEKADVERIIAGLHGMRCTTLRANTLKANRDEVARSLDAAAIEWEPVRWYDDAFVIRNAREKALWELPIYKEGAVYLQSLSSMLPAIALGAKEKEDVCDMCAAPGGKTSQIAALSGGRAYITACEMHAPRAEKLQYNLDKLGAKNITVMRTDARRLDDFFSFDRVLLDAPCSGSGTLNPKDPKTAKRFTQQLVTKSVKSQRALFAKALSLLKVGSTLVYSTCSVLQAENEDIVREGMKAARRQGSFEIEPISLLEGQDGSAQDGGPSSAQGHNQACGPCAESAVSDFQLACAELSDLGLPMLPTTLEGTVCLCPTELYEGFFIARIKRTA